MKYLHKIKRNKIIDEKFFVFDVETRGLSARPESFIFGCIYGMNYRKVFYSHDEFEMILADKRFNKSIIFAHNAIFDLSVMYDNVLENLDNKAIFNGRFIAARRDGITFADSFNIFPFSVEKIGKQIGLEKLDINKGFKDGTITEITHKEIEYCIRDCEIVYKALQEIFNVCGGVKITLAGLALHLFKNTYIPAVIKSDDKYIYDFFRSYYGGRVEAFLLGKISAHKYDINSMYPYSMKEAVFPNPNKLRKKEKCGKLEFKYLLGRFEGMVEATVIHKDSHIGLLPFRYNNKLTFPIGTFRGCWNFNEIRFALETGLVQIKEIHEVIYSDRWKSPFYDFVSDIYEKRKNSTGIYNTIYKLVLNSLYGKFAQKIKYDETYFSEIPYDYLVELHEKGQKFEIVRFNKNREDCYLRIPKEKNLNHTIPLLSSYITSHSRVILLRYILKHQKTVAYVDTDSICLTEEEEYNSKELGELKKEKGMITHIYGNKSYEEEDEGIAKLKMKGIPAKAIRDGNIFRYQKMTSTKESIRRNKEVGHFLPVEKNLKLSYDKRIVLANGKTKPLKLK